MIQTSPERTKNEDMYTEKRLVQLLNCKVPRITESMVVIVLQEFEFYISMW